jgi:colanic acid/amylovoran biosynthesis glycosyltransferase
MPLRIAYVVHMFPKLSETFIAQELAELLRRGVEVRVLSLLPPRESLRHDFIGQHGLDQLVCYEPENFPDVIRVFKPDLLHAHFATEPAATARDLSAQLHVPFTFTAHGYDIRRKPPADFAARAAAARRVITVSEANARWITERHHVPREHVRVIPCGVDTESFRPLNRGDRRDNHRKEPLILCVARHVAVKNLGLLLDACARLNEEGVRFRCVSIGDGPLRAELEAKRRELRLDTMVEFTGALAHEEVLRWWQRADIATLTSGNEGMPVSLMEAAACGVPAVATAVGGIPELIVDGVTGLLAPANDVGSLTVAFRNLIERPALLAEMAQAARARALERFSLARQIDALLAAWNEVLS